MSTPTSPVPDTDVTVSEPIPSDTNQLKRKTLGGSPEPDALKKRAKIEEKTDKSPELVEGRGRNGNVTTENGHNKQHDSPAKYAIARHESQPPDARRALGHVDRSSSPEQHRRPTDPRGNDDRSRTGSADRRGSQTERRTSSFGAKRERDRRESFSKEEKKRGKRLFGGLLSTLSQTTTNSQQKRRLEIEKRQQEKAAQQTREDDKRRSEKLAKLERVRKIEQIRFDEQVMRTRHSNMLAMAHSLRTRSEPKIYYRPWELLLEEEAIIKDQVRNAEIQIEDEVKQFKRRKEQRLKDLGVLPPSSEIEATVGEQAEERSNNAAPDESPTAATATNDHKPSPASAPAHKSSHHEDRDHDEMVEAEEDTVIY